ncbi:Integral membrane protein OS=Kitasatospora aureofaciens OX=1894 GN=GCM10010502_54130 PE=4 SV=1 [Kitasatospora aureofaciens]
MASSEPARGPEDGGAPGPEGSAAPGSGEPVPSAHASPAGAGAGGEGVQGGVGEDVAQLSARIAALEAATPPRGREHRRWRTSGAVVLIVIASLLSLLSVLAVWTSDFVGDTDRYVRTVAPLASQPDVQTAVTNRVTQVVLEQIDVNALVKELSDAAAQQGVPQNAANLINDLSGPIKSGLTQLVGSVVNKVVTSSAFETVWVEANRAVHSSLDKALTGQGGGAIKLENNQVAIDLAPVIAKVKDELVNAGLGVAAKIPDVHTNFVVFASDDIGKVKSYLRLLDIMGAWLPVVTVLIAAGGVFLAVNRRRALVGAAVGVALAMLLLGIALTVFRAFYLDHLPPGADQAAAGTVYDTLIRFMRATVRAVGTVAVVTAVGAALIGPSRPAVAVRTGCRRIIGSLRGALYSLGMRLGPVGPFVHRFKRWIGALILLVAAVILATWSYPTWAVVLWITFFVALAFAIREFLDTGGDGDRAPTPTTTGGPPPANA